MASFSWRTNSWQGDTAGQDLSNAFVTANAPAQQGTYLVVPQQEAHSLIYQIPTYTRLGDMSTDKSDETVWRGGYTGENPNRQPRAMHCVAQTASAKNYCTQPKMVRDWLG